MDNDNKGIKKKCETYIEELQNVTKEHKTLE